MTTLSKSTSDLLMRWLGASLVLEQGPVVVVSDEVMEEVYNALEYDPLEESVGIRLSDEFWAYVDEDQYRDYVVITGGIDHQWAVLRLATP